VRVALDDVKQAAIRIAPSVRRTPLVEARCTTAQPYPGGRLLLKLECLQVTGSFKARGAINKLLSLTPEEVRRGIVTASGGNHGLAVAYAGWLGKTTATIFLPENASAEKVKKLEQWGARVRIHGRQWHEANGEALRAAEREGLTYIHPFADPLIIAGQGTAALEILDQAPGVDEILVAIGGGGLISGVALTAKSLHPSIRVVGVEPTGAATLYESRKAGRVVALPAITTRVPTLAAQATEPINFALVQRFVDDLVLIGDDAMATAARWLWFEMGIAADLSGAAALAALMSRAVTPAPGRTVCALVTGAGPEGIV